MNNIVNDGRKVCVVKIEKRNQSTITELVEKLSKEDSIIEIKYLPKCMYAI